LGFRLTSAIYHSKVHNRFKLPGYATDAWGALPITDEGLLRIVMGKESAVPFAKVDSIWSIVS